MFQHFTRTAITAAALSIAGLLPTAAWAQGDSGNPNVISDGFEDLSYGKSFFIQVPMIDEPPAMTSFVVPGPAQGGIGMNITAESIINSVRYAGENPDIQHVVFMMRTGGGKMFHAEAMMHVIDDYHDTTEFHIIIDDAISAGTWTVFSCDTVFMVDSGSVGGAVIYVNLPNGTVQESPEIPAVAARMAKLAERNGHPGVLLPAMMHLPAELHYWEEDGEIVLSDHAPASSTSVQNHEVIDSDTSVLTLTSEQAFKIGFAERIEDFNSDLVGEHIGVPGWTRANHYGQVIHEIADIYNVTRFDQDQFQANLDAIPYFRDNRENRDNPNFRPFLERRDIFEKLVSGYEKINEALNNLPYVHPERHIYFADDEGRTILADPEQWKADVQASRNYIRSFNSALRDVRSAFRQLEYDTDNMDQLEEALELVSDRIEGIARDGNVAYWYENEVELDLE
jgi:hypothetical protein